MGDEVQVTTCRTCNVQFDDKGKEIHEKDCPLENLRGMMIDCEIQLDKLQKAHTLQLRAMFDKAIRCGFEIASTSATHLFDNKKHLDTVFDNYRSQL